VTRLLDRGGHHTLMLRARAGLAAWADLAFLGYVFAQQIDLLVLDHKGLVCAKLAKLGLCEKLAVTAAFAARITTFITFFTHDLLQLMKVFENLFFTTKALSREDSKEELGDFVPLCLCG